MRGNVVLAQLQASKKLKMTDVYPHLAELAEPQSKSDIRKTILANRKRKEAAEKLANSVCQET